MTKKFTSVVVTKRGRIIRDAATLIDHLLVGANLEADRIGNIPYWIRDHIPGHEAQVYIKAILQDALNRKERSAIMLLKTFDEKSFDVLGVGYAKALGIGGPGKTARMSMTIKELLEVVRVASIMRIPQTLTDRPLRKDLPKEEEGSEDETPLETSTDLNINQGDGGGTTSTTAFYLDRSSVSSTTTIDISNEVQRELAREAERMVLTSLAPAPNTNQEPQP